MTKRMLIDATHMEETRVAVVDGTRLMEFDYESQVRRQIKGSIFLAKVTRVEPSLQASFVNFGGNRHGFLPFAEIHPDYYRIPIADREALLAEQRAEMEALLAEERAAEEEEERAAAAGDAPAEEDDDEEEDIVEDIGGEKPPAVEPEGDEDDSTPQAATEAVDAEEDVEMLDDDEEEDSGEDDSADDEDDESDDDEDESEDEREAGPSKSVSPPSSFDEDGGVESFLEPEDNIGNVAEDAAEEKPEGQAAEDDVASRGRNRGGRRGSGNRDRGGRGGRYQGGRNGGGRGRYSASTSRRVEVLGGDGLDGDRPVRPTSRRHYKIQEVIKRGQIMLVQASKEERGNKGAAVTTYLSLPGRYCVLMPNSPRGGGVSRKIANFVERKRMREILAELNVPEGMSVIMRTAGMSRTKVEIKRDLDYLLRLWDEIRELTLQSSAPALIHEEGKLIRRAVRDLYSRDIEEIHVAGEEGFKAARDFMKVMMPSHVKRVIQYKDEQLPIFQRYQVESQIREMGEPTVTLKSGGYLVINPTEALVSVDVNSGRATRERHIEDTALKTNLEAAEEVARQLRLRDLGGLVVIDFIDMEDRRNNAKVERKLRDALSTDRARIQMGRISSFGLMEMSRQRLNPSLTEAQFEKCKHCQGIGHIRTCDNAAILALRALEEEGVRARAAEVHLTVSPDVAIYILNQKREMLADIERRYEFRVVVKTEDVLDLVPAVYKIDIVRPQDDDDEEEGDTPKPSARTEESAERDGRRSRGGRGRGRDRQSGRTEGQDGEPVAEIQDDHVAASGDEGESGEQPGADELSPRPDRGDRGRRRGRRGGRGRDREPRQDRAESSAAPEQDEQPSDSGLAVHADRIPVPVAGAPRPAVEPVYYGRRSRPANESAQDVESAPAAVAGNVGVTETRPYEVITDPDAVPQKKKGWWNKLVE